jgi:hypothetical protein
MIQYIATEITQFVKRSYNETYYCTGGIFVPHQVYSSGRKRELFASAKEP